MKQKRIWILIADGGHAKVFETRGQASELVPVEGKVFSADQPANRDLLTDRPGRSFESQGRARHAKEHPSDPHRELKRAFARKLAGLLEVELAAKRFGRLVLVAPPPMLGDLREAMPANVQAKVTAELAHDLVKTPLSELPKHLAVAPDGKPGR